MAASSATVLRFQFILISMVERWFGPLTERQLRRGVHRVRAAPTAAPCPLLC